MRSGTVIELINNLHLSSPTPTKTVAPQQQITQKTQHWATIVLNGTKLNQPLWNTPPSFPTHAGPACPAAATTRRRPIGPWAAPHCVDLGRRRADDRSGETGAAAGGGVRGGEHAPFVLCLPQHCTPFAQPGCGAAISGASGSISPRPQHPTPTTPPGHWCAVRHPTLSHAGWMHGLGQSCAPSPVRTERPSQHEYTTPY